MIGGWSMFSGSVGSYSATLRVEKKTDYPACMYEPLGDAFVVEVE
jgi:hypothetical protein